VTWTVPWSPKWPSGSISRGGRHTHTHTYLSTLEDLGCVRSDGDEDYVGVFMIPMGEYVRSGSVMYEAGRKEVDKLASETGEVSHFIIQPRGCEIRLYDRFGCRRRGTLGQCQRISTPYLHCTASGKAILAHLETSNAKRSLTDTTSRSGRRPRLLMVIALERIETRPRTGIGCQRRRANHRLQSYRCADRSY
jgi:DNA-binding IclR family transcriptional regulator